MDKLMQKTIARIVVITIFCKGIKKYEEELIALNKLLTLYKGVENAKY